MTMRGLVTLVAALLLLSTTDAGAVGSLAKMQSVWHFHAINDVNDADGTIASSYIEKCRFRVNRQGAIVDDPCGESEQSFFESVSFAVERSCAVQFEIGFPCRYDGQFTANQKLATGVGFCQGAAETPDLVYFSLVKG